MLPCRFCGKTPQATSILHLDVKAPPEAFYLNSKNINRQEEKNALMWLLRRYACSIKTTRLQVDWITFVLSSLITSPTVLCLGSLIVRTVTCKFNSYKD